MDDLPHIEVTALCHMGAVRGNNEDTITVAGWIFDEREMPAPRRSRHSPADPLLFAVADGMGGHAGGEVASRYAVKRLTEQPAIATAADVQTRLRTINAELHQTMTAVPSLLGMGTTIVGLVLSAQRALWFNVGDSRIYRHRDGRLEQLSIDDVPPGPRFGLITQTLGGSPMLLPITPHIGEDDLMLPSRWLLCSDGLTDMIEDATIEQVLRTSDEDAVCTLFAAAMEAGGADNISIVLGERDERGSALALRSPSAREESGRAPSGRGLVAAFHNQRRPLTPGSLILWLTTKRCQINNTISAPTTAPINPAP
jgi:serine/threonine protein phosphatase PrpC